MLNLTFRIELIQDRISIALISSCEYYYVKMLADILDDFFSIRPDVHITAYDLPLKRFERNFNLVSLHHDFTSVNESLIHIKNNGLST